MGVSMSDYDILSQRVLGTMLRADPDALVQFNDAPIIVGRKVVRDAVNVKKIIYHAQQTDSDVRLYYARDYRNKAQVLGDARKRLLRAGSSMTEDALSRLPLFPGMKVMVTSNLAFSKGVVNGAEGTVNSIKYSSDHEGRRFATVVYVRIPGAGLIVDDLGEDIVPIFPERKRWIYRYCDGNGARRTMSISRLQVPLTPGYAYTDYKSQGRSLDRAIVDLMSAKTLQGRYVMLSRVKTIGGLAIMRWFPPSKVYDRASEELRCELKRIDNLDQATSAKYVMGNWA